MDKQQEKKVLGIIAIVLGVIALLLSWMPIVNNFAAVLAFIGLILGVIALIVNRKNKKVLAIVGTVLAVISLIIVFATQSMYTKAIDKAGDDISSSMSSSDDKESKNFKWTTEDYDALTVGDALSGVGGENYDDVVSQFGKPTTKSEAQTGDYTLRSVSWTKTTSDGTVESVDLGFTKQADGSYLLSTKNSASLN